MRLTPIAFFLSLVALHAVAGEPTPASLKTDVVFVHPEHFTDLKAERINSDRDREFILGQLRDALVRQAESSLAAGERLAVTVTDVDLAGAFEPWQDQRLADIRILRENSPPRVELDFRLSGPDGSVLAAGQRELIRPGYLSSTAVPSSDPLRFDKQLLRDWVRREFGHREKSS